MGEHEAEAAVALNDFKIGNENIETEGSGNEIVLRKTDVDDHVDDCGSTSASFTSSVITTHITYNAHKVIKFPKEKDVKQSLETFVIADDYSVESEHEEGKLQEIGSWRSSQELSRRSNWQLEIWLPERRQGPTNKYRIVGKMTSDHNPFRLLNVEILGKISTPDETQKQQTVFSQNIQVANTKERSIYIFKVPENYDFVLELEFSSRAFIFPVSFQFAIRPVANKHLSSFEALSWLEDRLQRIPIDDKILIAQHLLEEQKRGWQSLDGACAMEFDNSMGVAEMQRCSQYKIKAYKLGMIRPFLLLVSMHPRRRIAWANSLGINLVKKHAKDHGKRKTFGDSHWEAHYILTAQRKGFIDRVSRTFREKLNPLARHLDWFQALHRVLCNVLSTTSPGFIKVFQAERMDAEMKGELDQCKGDKDETMKASQNPQTNSEDEMKLKGLSPIRLENVFTRYFFQTSNIEKVQEIIQSADCGIASVDEFHDAAVKLVRSDPELNERMQFLARHGFTEEKGAALAVLNSMKKEAMPVTLEQTNDGNGNDDGKQKTNQLDFRYNKERWTSDTEKFNEEFRQKVENRCKAEKRLLAGQTLVPMAVVTLVACLTVSPAVVTILMLTRTGIKAAFPNVPATVAALVSGVVMQRLWLAISDIGIEKYYPTKDELKLYEDFVP